MKPSVMLTMLAALVLGAAPLGSVRADIESECREIARDEEVPSEDLEDFLAECMASADTVIPEPESEESGLDTEAERYPNQDQEPQGQ